MAGNVSTAGMTEEDAFRLPPLALAYVGDAVWEVHIRTRLVLEGETRPQRLHQAALDYVRADRQADRLRVMAKDLTDREQTIVRRGRNAKSTAPRRAKVGDYRISTGFEALLGYLYLSGSLERLQAIMALLSDEKSVSTDADGSERERGSKNGEEL